MSAVKGHARGRLLWPAAVILIAVLAAWPLLEEQGLLNTRGGGDSPFLIQRLQQLMVALADGHFPVRWMPDANYGYGYPFYNYYAPLSLYIAALFRLIGFSLTRSLQLSQLLGFLVAAWSVFALVKQWWGNEWAALLAAAAYSVAPFHMVNVYVRGDSLAEFWAMAFYPLLLLAISKLTGLSQYNGARIFWLGLAYAGLILSHNVSALIFSPFLLLYIGVVAWAMAERRAFLVAAGSGLLLGLLLSAWFWLPALAETGLAQTGPITAGYFHYSAHFRSWDLVQPSLLFDYDVAGGQAFRMGLVQLVLALAGGLVLVWRRRSMTSAAGRLALLFTLLLAFGATFMITPLSRPLWANLPLLPFAQFPWRFLSVQALATALLTGGLVNPSGRVNLSGGRLLAPAILLLLLASGLLGLKTVHLPLSDAEIDGVALAQYEWFTGNIGTTVSAEYLPATVVPRPQTSSWLNRGARNELQALDGVVSGQLVARKSTAQEWQMAVVSGPATVILPTLYWPGWTAEVNGEASQIGPAPGSGLIAVPLNSGKHTVSLRLRRTPVRLVAELLSLGTGLLVLGWTLWGWRPAGRPASQFRLSVALVVLALLFLRIGAVIDNSFQPTSTDNRSWDFAQLGYLHGSAEGIPFADGSRLLRYSYRQTELRPGELMAVNSVWADAEGLEATLELVTPAQERPALIRQVLPPVVARDSQPISLTGADFLLVLPGNMPPGLYIPRLTVREAGKPVAALTDNGEPRGDLYLEPIRVIPFADLSPPEAYQEEPIPPPFRLDIQAVHLRPNRTLAMELAWLTTAGRSHDYNVSLRLSDIAGNFLAQLDTAPGFGFLPSSRWPVNEWINDWLVLPLPAALPDEPLTLTARLYRLPDGEVVFTRRLGELTGAEFVINTPVFSLPEIEQTAAVQFGELISLRGYSVEQSETSLLVTLYWQADALIPADYSHFVHLVRPGESEPVAQHDAMPQNNNYPTTQWTQAEIVIDQMVIPLDEVPAGRYEIRVGLYRPDTPTFDRLSAIALPDTPLPDDQFTLETGVIVSE